MKSLITLVSLLIFSAPVAAQTALDQQIELARQTADFDRQTIIQGNMNLTPGESDLFWPAWKEYRAAILANGDRMVVLIKEFAANYEAMSDIKADELMADYFSIRMQDLVIKQEFARKLNVLLPARKVMRITQIENKLDAAIQLQMAAEIPLAK